MNIKQAAMNLKNKYKTNNPIDIINYLGISLVFFPLGDEVNGVYQNEFDQPIIYINTNLSKEEQKLVAAHELGHFVLHEHVNMKFISRRTLQVKDRYERQADIFAAEFLLDDSIFENYSECTLKEISMAECVYPKFVEHKFNNL